MVSGQHEALHRMFQRDTRLMVRAINKLTDIDLPEPEKAEVACTDLTEYLPLERRLDTVIRLETAAGPCLLAIESQGRPDPPKRYSWPYYVAYLRARYKCEVILVVLSQDAATAEWAQRPLRCGSGSWTTQVTTPLVLGPEQVPMVVDEESVQRDTALAVFSAVTHANNADAPAILDLLAKGLGALDVNEAAIWSEHVELGLAGNSEVQKYWRELMSTLSYFFKSEAAQTVRREGREEGLEEGLEEGHAKTQAQNIVTVLERRGLAVPEAVRERVLSCRDGALLDAWWERVFDVSEAAELFMTDASSGAEE